MRLTFVYDMARQPRQQRLLASAKGIGRVVRIGDYVVGDEDCPWLYGPADVRY
ncbi:hypothetical protein [Hymenobacter lapidiphilus]|uniref:hypothetical protein n=1 Tax=Hymenobacter sp. CCM 8763 TaxID=2303334 RepID=UPI00167EB234|nr:hypothetical protein [Hymenobacter sp. CCM 8763]